MVLTAGKCRSCDASIVWVKTAASDGAKSMPMDARPAPDGNVWLNDQGRAVVAANHGGVPAGKRAFLSHFATCPNRAEHRRSKR